MRVYFKFLCGGELPVIHVGDRTVLTVEDGKARNARKWRDATKVYAHEKWYIEKHDWWHQHYLDIGEEIGQWCDDPKIATLREDIRIPLMRDARSMCMRTALIFIRAYHVMDGIHGNHAVTMAAGMLGFNDIILADPWIKGPSSEFETEAFIDSIIDGVEIQDGMKRYGITPRGRIINPLPPICECGHRHYGNIHQENYAAWEDRVINAPNR